jgi:hypothetical protein
MHREHTPDIVPSEGPLETGGRYRRRGPRPQDVKGPDRPVQPYGQRVSRISFFYVISSYMYWNEAHHARPHFHAR